MEKLKRYNAAIYCRLSKDDDLRSGESSSISTQKLMLEKYVKDNNWTIVDYYIDDGYSGTNYNRPDFQRMIEDIEQGKINMVVVKDLSRLGRNYLITGQYTEVFFPDRNVRFVAIDDGVDSLNNNNDIAPFKNILNEMYAKDISKKVRSAVRAKKQKGDFLSNYAPYGYKKAPDNKNRLVIEETSAKVVKQIFEMARIGMGSKMIVKKLNDDNIPTPIEHRNLLLGKPITNKKRWSPESVISILRSRIYLGDMVQGVYECSRFKRTPTKRKPPEEWIITPNMHEPLVDVETWEYIQKCIDGRFRPIKSKEIQLFAGFIKCADCGYALGYSASHGVESYSCGQYRRHGSKFCSCHYIRKDTLEEIVLNDINRHVNLVKDKNTELATILSMQTDSKDKQKLKELNSELETLKSRYTELNAIIKRLYEDNVTGRITDERFDFLINEYEKEQTEVKQKIEDAERSIKDIENSKVDLTAWIELIQKYTHIDKLDRTILGELIDKITVGETKTIDNKKSVDITIYYKFIGAIG